MKTKQQWNDIDKIKKVSTQSCDIRCDDDKLDRCGGKHDIFSVYKLIGLPISKCLCFSNVYYFNEKKT